MSLEIKLTKEIYRILKYNENSSSSLLEIVLKRVRLCGALPETKRGRILSSCVLGILFFNIITILYNIITTSDIIEALDCTLILMGFLLIFYNYYDFQKNSDKILKLICKVDDYYKKSQKNIHPDMQKRFNFLFSICGIFDYLWSIILAISLFLALILKPIIMWEMELPMQAKYPFDISTKTTFFIVAIFQAGMFAYNLFVIVVVDTVVVTIIFYTFMFFELLHHKVKALDKAGLRDEEARNILKEIVTEHQFLNKIVHKTNKVLSGSLSAQIIASYAMLGFSGFMAVATSSPLLCFKFSVYFFALLSQASFWCINGHQPHYASEHLSDVLMECNWLDRSVKFRKDFIFVLARAQKPILFKGNNDNLVYNYATLLSICRKSYTAFALLRTMIQDIQF
uniref:Odorant receptor n=1 Tax=Culicoides sonorensis TaxID=179676 RepID=A0A336KQP7_CULSO